MWKLQVIDRRTKKRRGHTPPPGSLSLERRHRTDRRSGRDRREKRLTFQSMFFFNTDDLGEPLKKRGLLIDFSYTGIRIQTARLLQVEATLRFQTSFAEHKISGIARVVHVRPLKTSSFLPYHAGLCFIHLADQDHQLLSRYLASFKPHNAPLWISSPYWFVPHNGQDTPPKSSG